MKEIVRTLKYIKNMSYTLQNQTSDTQVAMYASCSFQHFTKDKQECSLIN